MIQKGKYKNLIEALKQKASEILPPGSRLALYGSRARGDARDDSDWDLHILVPGGERLSLTEEDELCNPFFDIGLFDFEEIVNPRAYTYSGWAKRSFLPFYKNVENDKIVLFEN